MKLNISKEDKIVRLLLAILLIVLFLTKTIAGTAGVVVLAVAAILILTALVNFCPIYHFLGISTRKKN